MENNNVNHEGKPNCKKLEDLMQDLKQKIEDNKFPGNAEPRTDSTFLTKFLRTKDYNVDAALRAVQKYYAFKFRNQSLFENVQPSDTETVVQSDMFSLLKDKFQGAQVVAFRIKHWHPKQVSLKTLHQAIVFLMEHYSENPELQENGVYIICDLDGFRFEHVWRFSSVKEIRRTVEIVLEGIPIRVKGIHYVNTPSLFLPIHTIGLRFVKEKIRKRVHLHFNLPSLHEMFGKEILPEFLGGNVSDLVCRFNNLK